MDVVPVERTSADLEAFAGLALGLPTGLAPEVGDSAISELPVASQASSSDRAEVKTSQILRHMRDSWPHLFRAPWAAGVQDNLVLVLNSRFDEAMVNRTCKEWFKSMDYHRLVVSGSDSVTLTGQCGGPVSDYQRGYSEGYLSARAAVKNVKRKMRETQASRRRALKRLELAKTFSGT